MLKKRVATFTGTCWAERALERGQSVKDENVVGQGKTKSGKRKDEGLLHKIKEKQSMHV